MKNSIKAWQGNHPDLWEFIKFNVLSNVATVTNFIFLWIGTTFLFKSFSHLPFQWFIFNYSLENGGLASFFSFLLAYVMAQIVNYFVQRYLVFGANNQIAKTIHYYILTVVVAGIISIILPPYVISSLTSWGLTLGFSQTLANLVNIVVQVFINYPMMKYVIMN